MALYATAIDLNVDCERYTTTYQQTILDIIKFPARMRVTQGFDGVFLIPDIRNVYIQFHCSRFICAKKA